MEYKRITLFAGHYGSGKTNIAVNYAIAMRKAGHPVRIADLDIVNPYFRTKDSADRLAEAGIELISSAYANTNVDIPALPAQMYALTDDKSFYAVMDIGGDDRGALALGRYAPAILSEGEYEMLFVANMYRPLTRTPAEALEVMREVEAAGGIPFTAIVNNSNIGADTKAEDILASVSFAEELSRLSGLPVKMTAVREDLTDALSGKIEKLFPLTLQKKYAWS